MKKRVLHVINTILPGGAETLLANSLSQGGLGDHTENHLAFFMAPSYLLKKIDKSVHIHFLDYKGVREIFKLIRQLRSIIVDNKIDIVHTHLNPAGLYTHLACPRNVAHIHTMHTTYSMDIETSPLKLWAEKVLYLGNKNTKLIFLSSFTQNDFLKEVSFKGQSFVLNNFVADNFFKPVRVYDRAKKTLKLVAVGRLDPVKNLEYLLDVFTYLREFNISLDIYGGGNIKRFEKLISEKKVNVNMQGHQDDMSLVLQNYDVLIMPSKYEGFGLAVFEAMASGLPVLLSNIVPFKSNIRENALYFDLDMPVKTADIIKSIFNGDIDLTPMAEKANRFANETVRRDRYVKRLLSIYDEICLTPES